MVNMAQTNLWNAYEKFIPAETPILKRHLRGAWISTVVNLDWPSTETVKIGNTVERITKSKEELTEILDRAVELKLNAVFFQVSPEGDAFTNPHCSVVPLSQELLKRSRFRTCWLLPLRKLIKGIWKFMRGLIRTGYQ